MTRSAWDVLCEALRDDPDDELADFAGEIRPRAWDGFSPLPDGHRSAEAMGVMHDGTRMRVFVDRGDGSYDAAVYSRPPESGLRVVRSSEFRFTTPLRHPDVVSLRSRSRLFTGSRRST